MDSYPSHLSPGFNEDGSVRTSFEEWWAKSKHEFPDVPEDVARQWIHRHWGQSFYDFLSSRRYTFSVETWGSRQLIEIKVGEHNWLAETVLQQGELIHRHDSWVSQFMREHSRFPDPIIVLDNREGWIESEPSLPAFLATAPRTYLLIEGHRRHALGCWMTKMGTLAHQQDIWLMSRPAHMQRG